jgi:hypothetical protein
MTTRMKSFAIVLAILAFGGAAVYAQTATHNVTFTVNPITVIQVQDATTIDLAITAPANPGDDPQGDSDSSKYLQYTVLTATSASIGVTLANVTGSIPAGTRLDLTSTPVGGEGTGATITLAVGANANLITAIPSCATVRMRPMAPNLPSISSSPIQALNDR